MIKKFPDHTMLTTYLADVTMEFIGNFGGEDVWVGSDWHDCRGPCILLLSGPNNGSDQSWCDCKWYAESGHDFSGHAPTAATFAIEYSRAMAALFR